MDQEEDNKSEPISDAGESDAVAEGEAAVSADPAPEIPLDEQPPKVDEDLPAPPIEDARSSFSSVDPDDLERLAAAFHAFDGPRAASCAPDRRSPNKERIRAMCSVLITGPYELGIDAPAEPPWKEAQGILREAHQDDTPEIEMCRLWLREAAGEDIAGELERLTHEVLWTPLQPLLYRSLAFYGRQDLLAAAFPAETPTSLWQSEVLLDGALPLVDPQQLAGRLKCPGDELLPEELTESYRSLLAAEADPGSPKSEEIVKQLAGKCESMTPPRTYAEAVRLRLRARAILARCRLLLGQGRAVADLLPDDTPVIVSKWERAYLRGLGYWRIDELKGAEDALRDAMTLNPHQTAPRIALAALLADRSTEEAVGVLDCGHPTREVVITRAALLARLGRYEVANEALERVKGDASVPCEPLRFSWPEGRLAMQRLEHILRCAMSERKGDWKTARPAWMVACRDGAMAPIERSRQLFMDKCELDALPEAGNWRRAQLTPRIAAGKNYVTGIPLRGDAMFYRAAALADSLPERAAKDFQGLICQRSWYEAEQRAGGRKIIFAGDWLLRLGNASGASQAYSMVGETQAKDVSERRAVALVYQALLQGAHTGNIDQAAARAAEIAPDSFWPLLVASVGSLMTGRPDKAIEYLTRARERGAPESLCGSLGKVCAAANGDGPLDESALAALPVPEDSRAALRLLYGEGDEVDRLLAFAQCMGEDWLVKCPLDAETAVRRVIARFCDEGEWDRARGLTRSMARTGAAWVPELEGLVRLRYALSLATRGDLAEAERELTRLETDWAGHRGKK